jgi:hypothetical protein
MAQSVIASIYGANSNDWNEPAGVTMGFPTQGIIIRAISPAVSYSGVACNTQIQLLPTAPSPIQPVYYSPIATATLITNANA